MRKWARTKPQLLKPMKRRTFIKTVGGAAGVAALGAPNLFGADRPMEKVAGMPRRVLGRTGQKISVVGFPGLALNHYDQEKGTAAQAHEDPLQSESFSDPPGKG